MKKGLSLLVLFLLLTCFVTAQDFHLKNQSEISNLSIQSVQLTKSNIIIDKEKMSYASQIELNQKQNKSSNEIFYKPSIIIENGNSKNTYSYGTQGNVTAIINETSTGGVWQNNEMYEYNYDNNWNLLLQQHYLWNGNDWIYSDKITYEYDVKGNLLCKTTLYGTNNIERNTYTFDDDNNLATAGEDRWINGRWVCQRLYYYSYDSNGYLLSSIEQTIYDNALRNDVRKTFTYSAKGEKLSLIYEDFTNSGWINYLSDYFTYNENSSLLTTTEKVWRNNSWEDFYRIVNTYNANNNLLSQTHQNWLNNAWIDVHKLENTYDLNFNPISTLILDSNLGGLTNFRKVTRTYDDNNNKKSESDEIWRNDAWLNYELSSYSFDENNNGSGASYFAWNNGIWEPSWGKVNIYYNNCKNVFSTICMDVAVEYMLINDVNDNELNSTTYSLSNNYPNPFNPNTTISFSLPKQEFVTLKIYDILGKEIATLFNEELTAGTYNKNWQPKNISSGIYFYRLQAGKYSETRKMNLLK